MVFEHLDLSRVSAMGDPSTSSGRASIRELFGVYLESTCEACRRMRTVAEPTVSLAEAHRAKGASDVIGATAVAALLADIEARAAAGERVDPATIEEVERALDAVRQDVRLLLGDEVGL